MRYPKDPKATWFVRTHAEASRGRLSHQKKTVENYPHSNTNQLPFFTRIQNPRIQNPSLDPLGFPRVKTTAARPNMLLRAKGLKRSLPIGLIPLPSFRRM